MFLCAIIKKAIESFIVQQAFLIASPLSTKQYELTVYDP